MPKSGPGISRTLVRVLILLGLSVFINYIDRANLSIAAPLLKVELHLSASQLGILLSAFFWTYACMQITAGWLVDRFEVKWVLATGFFVWTVATAATGFVHTFATLMAVRVVLGIGESVAYPAYSKIFSAHFVERQRGVANSAIGAGQALGPALGMLFGGVLVARFGWRPFFIGLGLLSLIWLPPWLMWMPRSVVPAPDTKRGPKFSEIIRQRSSWGTCIGHFCTNYGLYFLLTWLPYYLVADRHFSLGRMSKVGGATFFLAGLSSIVCGRISDFWISSGASPTRVRKTFMVIGMISGGACYAGCAAAPDGLFVVLLLLAGVAHGPVTSNLNAITQTLAGPLASGRWMGMQNFIANLAGAVAPALTGYLVDRTGHFYWPFLITASVAFIGALQWILVIGAVEPVDWKTELRPISALN
ncbi:MAG: transporter, family, D-galactonate transporter [Acidobacteriaceae bacterium]|nr:transporter, family, D-galactonate transporter [Acidobacteriaceae bacterium]